MPYVGRDLSRGNYLKLDDLVSQFNGSKTTFNLTSGGSAFFPGSAFSILVSLGGIVQEPESAYTINKSQITFASAPLATDEFFIIALGVALGAGVPGHGTVNDSQMAKPFVYDTYFYLDSANNRVGIHSATPTVALDVIGDIKLNGNLVTSGTGGGGFNAGVVTCTGLDVNGNADFSGNVSIGGTLTYLDVTNIDSVGIITAQQGIHLGIASTVGHLSTVGVSSIASLQVRDLTATHVAYAGANGRLTGSANLTYSSSVLQITKGTSGGATANTDAALIVDNSSHTYVQFRTPDNKEQGLLFGDDADNDAGGITYVHSSNHLGFRVNADERVRIDSSGRVLLGTDVAPASANTLLRVHTPISSSSANSIEIGHNTNGADKAGASLGLAIQNGGASTNAADLYFSTATNGSLTQKLWIRSDGHITPAAAGTQDLGSTAKEFRNLYIGNSGRVYLGDAQEVSLYHDGSNTYLNGGSGTGLMQIKNTGGGDVELFSNDKVKLRVNGGESAVICNNNNSVDLYYDASVYSTPKLKTSKVGVTVNGEVAASQDYPTIKPTLDLNFAATKTLDSRIEYYRYGPASYVDENGKVVLVGDDVPRFDHDPVTRECKGLLVEGERRNILPYSFDAGKWIAGSGGTLTRDAGIAPDGTMTATKALSSSNDIDVNPKISGIDGSGGNITVSSSVTYTLSVWAKASTTAQIGNNFKVRMKRVSGSGFNPETTFALTGNWARYSVTGTTPANVTQVMCYVGWVSGSEALVWGAQLESGTTASSLIPTYGYTQLRGSDVVEITGEDFTDFYNQAEGTIFLSASYETDARAVANVTIDDTSNYSEYTEVGYRAGGASTQQLASYIRTDTGNDQYYKNWSNAITEGTEFKIALAYKDDNYASHASTSGTPGLPDAANVHTDSSGTTSRVYDRLKFSEVHTVGHGGVGHYRRLMYYSKRLTDSQIFTLTL